jgi:hypothetical protein
MCPASNFNKPQQSGFALLITIVLMSMLVLIMVGFSSLTRVEIQIANNSQTQDRARQNALMALNIALGELQKNLGPDQRSTATAAIFTDKPYDLANADVKNPHWLGVFKTRDASNLTANLEAIRLANVGYNTQNNLAGDLPPISPEVTWLASLPKPLTSPKLALTTTVEDLVSTTTDSREITMAKIKDSSTATIHSVQVGYVPLKTDSNFPGATSGGFAWWVTDESLKAKVNKVPAASPSLTTAQQQALDFSLANKTDLRVLDNTTASKPNLDPATAATSLTKVLTPNQIQFAGTDFKSAVTPLAGDITTYSKTIPVDVSQGRLKQDLSAYLGKLSATVADSDPVIRGFTGDTTYSGPQLAFRPDGLDLPTFGLIKNWARLTTDTSNPPLPQKQDMRTKQHFAPIVLRWGFTYQPGLEGGGPGKPASLTWRFKPAFVLCNPYDQPIAAADYLFQLSGNLKMILRPNFDNKGFPGELIGVKKAAIGDVTSSTSPDFYEIKNAGGVPSDFDLYNYLAADPGDLTQIDPINNTNKIKWMNFVLRGQRLEPGETIVLSPKYDRAYNNQSADWYVSQTSAGREAGNVLVNERPENYGYNITTTLTAANNGVGPTNGASTYGYYWICQSHPSSNTNREQSRFRLWSLSDPSGASIVQDFSTTPFTQGVSDSYMLNLIDMNAIYGTNVMNRGVHSAGSPQTIRDNAAYSLNSDKFTGRTHMISIGGMDTGQSTTTQRNVCSLAWMLQNARAPSMSTNFDTVGLPGYRWLPKVKDVSGGAGQPDWGIGALGSTAWTGGVINSYGRQTTHAFTRLYPDANNPTLPTTYCFYHLPDKDEVIGSMGLLQHVNFSPHYWMPHYPFGNSAPMMAVQRDLFYGTTAGVSAGARTGANISRVAIDADNALIDISTALNASLWDRFFLSTLPYEEGSFSFNTASILPNSNHRVTAPQTGTLPTWSDLKSGTSAFEQAARYVQVDGGFNVNSTSVAAWKLLLSGTHNRTVKPSLNPTGPDSNAANRTVFPRTPKPLFAENTTTTGYVYEGAFGTAKSLDNSSASASLREVDLLATAIVEEVKRRGPFLSLADFVNRRLIPDQTNEEGDWLGLGGTLQVAIDKVTQNNLKADGSVNQPIINAKYHIAGPAPFKSSEGTDWMTAAKTGQTSQLDMSEHMNGGTPSARFAVPYRSGPGYLMQADVLQAIAPLLTVRGDTFVVRTYGDVTNPATGSTTPVARAWCEAVVQRIPETVDSADNIIQPGSSVGPAYDAKYPFGRRMKVVMFRWLSDAEVAQVVGQ